MVKGLCRASLFFICLTSSKTFGEEGLTSSLKQENAPYDNALKTMQAKKEQELALKQQGAVASSIEKGTSSVMMIEPQTRAQDFKEAFTYLSQYKAGSPLYFELESKEKLYGVTDISMMKGGSLVIFKMNTTSGAKFRVIKTENIISIGTD